MPTEIFGLPVHPFAVHLPVVLVPLLALAIAVYVLVPKLRHHAGWAVVALSVVAPAVVFVARWSGQQLAQQQLEAFGDTPEAAERAETISAHAGNGTTLLWLTLAAAPLAWIFTSLASGRLARFAKARNWNRFSSSDESSPRRTAVLVTLGVVLMGLAVSMTYFVVRAGHTGASMLWGA
ncbi:MAG: hypothetical protein ACRD0P_17220 [Stackebrandtia sp.]